MESTLAALRLLHAPGIGGRAVQKLLTTFGDPSQALQASDSELQQAGLNSALVSALRNVPDESFAADIAWADTENNHLIPIDHPLYPARLRDISDPPPVLFVTGDPEVLHTPQVALVGSRNPSAGGVENALRFAEELATRGLCITSGLAQGIDTASHQGALRANGLSVAVTGTGLDRVYPASNRALAHQLAEQGTLVSELPIGTPPKGQNFPRRNRIISALSLGVLVVEATVKSGSLVTARLATEQGREVLAIPGSIHNPMSRGCHALIRQGAKLVETADDVLEELAAQIGGSLAAMPSAEYQQLIDCMGYDEVTIDTLIDRSGFSSSEVSSMLLMLELTGKIQTSGNGRYRRN